MTKVALVVILLFSAFNVAQVMAKCPNCGGTGKVVCPNCDGEGVLTPNISVSGWKTRTGDGKVFVTGYFRNKEDFGAYGTPVAELKAPIKTYTDTGERTYFPPNEMIELTITVEVGGDYDYFANELFLRPTLSVTGVDETTCPVCGGTGFITCPDCGGTGGTQIDGEEEEEDEIINGGGRREQRDDTNVSFPVDWTLVGVGAIAAVAVAAVVVVKRKRVSENDLRKLPPNDFQNWVIQRISGKTTSLRDSRIGIDAYTAEGHPIKIMQSDNIGRNEIDSFASVMGRVKAKNGIVLAFSFSDDVYRGIVRARVNYGIEIKKATVKELIERKGII
jgi:hypothetical protein